MLQQAQRMHSHRPSSRARSFLFWNISRSPIFSPLRGSRAAPLLEGEWADEEEGSGDSAQINSGRGC